MGPYEVRDVTGRLVQAGASLPVGGLAVAGLPAGLYLLRVQALGGWLSIIRMEIVK